MPNDTDIATKTPAELSKLVLDYQRKLSEKDKIIKLLEEKVHLMQHRQFGKKSERDEDSPQANLFDEANEPDNASAVEAAEETITIPAHQRSTTKKPGRKPLPANLPRVTQVHDLSDAEKQCPCGCEMTCIGEVVTEQLDIIPETVQVIAHHHKKYACKACEETVRQAKHPAQAIPKSIATANTLARVLTAKFVDHLPLYRQEQQLKRIGVDIARSTLSLWVIKCSKLFEPLYERLHEQINAYDVAYADETTLQVLKEPGRQANQTSYMWLFGGGPPDKLSLCYHYAATRSHEVPLSHLAGFTGYLHCDGYSGYDALAKRQAVQQVGCWFHARRKFMDAAKLSNKAGLANHVLKVIKQLSQLERELVALTPEQRRLRRRNKAKPLINKLHTWLLDNQSRVLPKSTLGQAFSYMLNQWSKLVRYLDDGRLEMSNNRMERQMKPFATGRKNWLFANSVEGANAAAIIFSLIETAKVHGHQPQHYLKYVLTQLPLAASDEDIDACLPWNLKAN